MTLTMMCSRHGGYLSKDGSDCPGCEQDIKDGKMFVTKQEMDTELLIPSMPWPKEVYRSQDTEARASFRYRLREAARKALELGDALLQISQDATEPSDKQLKELRDLEGSLDVCARYRLPDIKP